MWHCKCDTASAIYLWALIPNRVLIKGHDGYTCTRSRWPPIGHWFKLSPARHPNWTQPQFRLIGIASVFTRAITFPIGWATQCGSTNLTTKRSCERAVRRDVLFIYKPRSRVRAGLCTISLSVHGTEKIAMRAACGPRTAGCRPLFYRMSQEIVCKRGAHSLLLYYINLLVNSHIVDM